MSQFFPGPGPLQDEFEAAKEEITALTDNIAKVQNGLAYIVGDTNTTGGTLEAGQFVYVKGHATIPEGLRKVTASISANGNITTNNTEPCSEGGLNALNSKLAKYGHFNVTIPSTAGSTSSGFSLPSGFTRANCIIENVSVSKFNGSNIYFQDTLANDGVSFVFTGDAVTVITSANTHASWLGETATVFLQSIV